MSPRKRKVAHQMDAAEEEPDHSVDDEDGLTEYERKRLVSGTTNSALGLKKIFSCPTCSCRVQEIIRRNREVLAAMGITATLKEIQEMAAPRRAPPKKRGTPAEEEHPSRRSARIAGGPPPAPPSELEAFIASSECPVCGEAGPHEQAGTASGHAAAGGVPRPAS